MIVSHDPLSTTIADRIVRIRDGRVSGESGGDGGDDRSSSVAVAGCGCRRSFCGASGSTAHATARSTAERSSSVRRPYSPRRRRSGRRPQHRQRPDLGAPAGRHEGYGAGAGARRRSFDAEFRAGTLTAVTGPSGSGKTTLLHLLAGLELAARRSTSWWRNVADRLDAPRAPGCARGRIGYVGQQPGLTPFLSARENVELGLALHQRARGRRARGARRRRPRRSGPTSASHGFRPASGDASRSPARSPRAPADPARRRADVAPRPGERALGRGPPRPARARVRRGDRVRHARPAADRAGGRGATPGLAREQARP